MNQQTDSWCTIWGHHTNGCAQVEQFMLYLSNIFPMSTLCNTIIPILVKVKLTSHDCTVNLIEAEYNGQGDYASRSLCNGF